MFVIGIILILAGAGGMFYGDKLNVDLLTDKLGQAINGVSSLLGQETSKVPGELYVYAGIAAVVIGVILVVGGRKK